MESFRVLFFPLMFPLTGALKETASRGSQRSLAGPACTMGDRCLSSAGAGKCCALPMRLPNPSPVPDKNLAPISTEFYPVLGGVCGGVLLGHAQTTVLCWINLRPRYKSQSATTYL